MTLTIQRYRAAVTISIATGRHNKVSKTIGTLLGRRQQKGRRYTYHRDG
jgi:hypothetical protein